MANPQPSTFHPCLSGGGLSHGQALAIFRPTTWTPWQFFLVALAGWMNRQQPEVIEFLREENRILREKLGGKRLLLNAEQKWRLAAKGKALGRRLLEQFGTLFSPQTILRWHRLLIARKYDDSPIRRLVGHAGHKTFQIRYGMRLHLLGECSLLSVCE